MSAGEDLATRIQARALADAIIQATAAGWLRRAAMFEAAMARPGDFLGRATAENIRARDERCAAAAEACRRRASLSELSEFEALSVLQDLARAA
jgi:hypothetical protein